MDGFKLNSFGRLLVIMLGPALASMGAVASTDFGFRISDFGLIHTPSLKQVPSPTPQSAIHNPQSGRPWLNLTNGRPIPTIDVGPAGLIQSLKHNLIQPTALASADFDEDGVPDLISGYVGPSGGLLTLHGGNLEALFAGQRVNESMSQWVNESTSSLTHAQDAQLLVSTPHGNESTSSLTHFPIAPLPFWPEARVFALPDAPDFLGAGDFDADGHQDLVAAARGSDVLYLLTGDGRGGFDSAQQIDLTGELTVLTTGEINRRDGLTDVVVGIVDAGGPKALVFESPEGALKGEPEIIRLSAPATALALGQLDDRYEMDLAIAAGHELVIVQGRDRSDGGWRMADGRLKEATVDQLAFPSMITSLAVGDFVGDQEHRTDIALLADDGAVHVLHQDSRPKTQKPKLKAAWRDLVRAHLPIDSLTHLPRLVRANVSSLPTDDLLMLDPAHHQLYILSNLTPVNESMSQWGNESTASLTHFPVDPLTTSLDTDGAPVAVLPMRLNVDALDDLAILREGASAPAVVLTLPMATFTVNSTLDAPDSAPGDGVCCMGSSFLGHCAGVCTLRAAIQEANASMGADAITFNISGAGPHTIQPTSPLPTITGLVTLDGTTDPDGGGMINLDGSQADVAHGLVISAGSSVIRGLAISGFHLQFIDRDGGTGIRITTAGGNIIEGNYIGLDATGAPVANLGNGIEIIDSPNNLIGGTTAAARNVISLNGFFSFTHGGVFISGSSASGNRVQGNYIGTDAAGALARPNKEDGVHISGAPNNTIGGTTAGARNVISGNEEGDPFFDCGAGVVIAQAMGTLVQGNYLGTDANGTTALGNGADGVFVGGSSNTIGGTTAGARNVISGNRLAGVELHDPGASLNLVQGNYIGTNAAGTAALGNGNGVYVLAANNTVGGKALGAGNVISGNILNGVAIAGHTVTGNRIEGNYIGTDPTGSMALGNAAHGVVIGVFASGVGIIGAPDNTIGGTTPGTRNIISGNALNGVEINGATSTGNQVQGNYIGTDVTGTADLGNGFFGVRISGAFNNTVGGMIISACNVISGNNHDGVHIDSGASDNQVLGNYIGTDATGTMDLGNSQLGVFIVDASANMIGGSMSRARNVISGNNTSGLLISGSAATGNSVQGNFIGTQANGTSPLGNSQAGVVISNAASMNRIGGTAAEAGNTIAFNGGDGVVLPLMTGTGNRVTLNSIHNNAGLGIDLGADGATPNDAGDSDTGPNNLQNFPVLTSATSFGGNSTDINGTLNSTSTTNFLLEFFANPLCDPSGHGEGRTFIGSASVTTIGNNATITVTLPVVVPEGHVITATATDPSGNTSELSACVMVINTCTLTCPANITTSNDPGQCGAVVTYSTPTTSGPCGSTVTCTPVSGSFFSKGTTTVTCTTTAGASCSFIVMITDTQPPTLDCPADIPTTATTGQCSKVVTYTLPMGNDNCPGVTVSCAPPSGASFSVGTTTVTCTATDTSGRTGSCSFTVTITDTQLPTLTCPSNIGVNEGSPGSGSATVSYTVPTPSDNCPGVTVSCTPPSGSGFPLGTTTVTCTATDASINTSSCTFTVTVSPCTITCPGNITKSNDPGQCGATVTYPVPTTTGNCGTVTCTPVSGSFFSKGTTTVTCTTTAGPSCSFMVAVSDTQLPTITCPANITMAAGAGCQATVSVGMAMATDNCPGVTVAGTRSDGQPLNAPYPGPTGAGSRVTTITWKATDASGLIATCTQTITVTNAAPTANAGADQTVDENTPVMLNGISSSDLNPGQTLTFQWTQTGGPPVVINNGNTATATFTAPEAPDLQCPTLTFQLRATDPCGAMATDTVAVSVTDTLVLQDDRSGHGAVIRRSCAGNAATYCWRKPDGSTISGPCTVTLQGSIVNLQSTSADPNLLQGSADLIRRTANARLTAPRGNRTTLTIVDSNMANSQCHCP
jgi:CSLREA domain-containing protein